MMFLSPVYMRAKNNILKIFFEISLSQATPNFALH